MKQLVVLSGKGGTGKTTVTAALAHLAAMEDPIVLADADVDAANLELVLAPQVQATHDFASGTAATIDPDLCTACGTCIEVCRFDAVLDLEPTPVIDPIACEGCAVCAYQCPAEAILLHEPVCGQWFISEGRYGPLVHARLGAGQENSGKLVTLVKARARQIAMERGSPYVLVDGPPGIGCPVIATCAGADLALLVTEPTVAGIHDLERVLATANHFRVPALVCINKHDLNPGMTQTIAEDCAARDIPVVGRIPFDQVVTEAMVQGQPVTEYDDGPVSQELRRVWEEVRAHLDGLTED